MTTGEIRVCEKRGEVAEGGDQRGLGAGGLGGAHIVGAGRKVRAVRDWLID